MEGRVLIIEDHAGNRELLSEHFEDEGLEVQEEVTGAEGIKTAIRTMPQVILLSTSLPDMPGTQVVERLREVNRTKHIFLMMLGDEYNREERLTSLDAGANDFVDSPFDADLVTLRVRNAINRKNQESSTDPTTGLPAGRRVQDELYTLLDEPEGNWALVRFRITNLEPFREVYGFMAGEDLLRGVGRILAESMNQEEVETDFLGYGGHDDFIVITNPEQAETMAETVKGKFGEEIGSYYGFFERTQGFIEFEGKEYPLASLRTRVVTPEDGPFYDIRSLTEVLAG